MKRLYFPALAALFAGALAASTIGTAFAQTHSTSDCHAHMQHNAAQMNQLHAELKLNAGQEAAWQTMAASMKTAHSEHAGMANASSMTVPAHIDAMLTMLHAHDVQMTNVARAVKAFYATLSADQRTMFDRAFQRGMMH